MKIINSQTWYDYCEYWTDNGIHIELNHGYGQTAQIRISIIENGERKLKIYLGYETSEKSVWKTTMLTALANRLVANNGAEIIRQVFTEYRGLVRL